MQRLPIIFFPFKLGISLVFKLFYKKTATLKLEDLVAKKIMAYLFANIDDCAILIKRLNDWLGKSI